MKMNGTIVIHCPVKDVAEFVMDIQNDAQWRYGVDETGWREGDSISPGSIGFTRVGKMEVEWKVLSSVPMESVDWELLNGPIKGRGGYRFKAVEGGTEFTLVADVNPTGLYKLLGPLFKRMGKRRNQGDVEKLRQILEGK